MPDRVSGHRWRDQPDGEIVVLLPSSLIKVRSSRRMHAQNNERARGREGVHKEAQNREIERGEKERNR